MLVYLRVSTRVVFPVAFIVKGVSVFPVEYTEELLFLYQLETELISVGTAEPIIELGEQLFNEVTVVAE